jgi:[acyl-carrier-protein] S-malonyltransferase
MSASLDAERLGLFPGQGAITSGAGLAWRHCASWSLVDQIAEITQIDVAHILLELSDSEVVRTDRAQLATFTLSLVGWSELCRHGSAPKYLAGHSLGEFSALVASGVLSLRDGAELVATRGRAMEEASRTEVGSMVALMGGDEKARERLDDVKDLWLANVNGPGQIVVSGSRDAIDHLLTHARDLGWRRASELNVGGAFHSPLMSPAQSALDAVLANVTFHETEHVIAANVDGQWRAGGDQWRDLLSRQLTSPVQYFDMITSLDPHVKRAVEMPPGSVLVGLTKRIRDFDELVGLSEPEEN